MTPGASAKNGTILGQHPPESLLIDGMMLAVFLSVGYLVRDAIQYTPDSSILFLLGLAIVTVGVEVLHEGLHKLAFRAAGVSATIEWSQLAVIPHEQEAPMTVVFTALVTPGVLVSVGLLGLAYLDIAAVITALLGFGLVLNVTLSVVDAFSAYRLVGEPWDSRLYFETTATGTRIHVIPLRDSQ